MATHVGSCACGGVKVTATCEPSVVSMCHCLMCQKRTGSTYSVHGYFPRQHVTVEGAAKRYARTGDSGCYIYFHFCPECGSTVFWEVEANPDQIGIPVGAFADPSFPPPTTSIFVPHKHPWVTIPSGVPQHEGHGPAFLAATVAALARRK